MCIAPARKNEKAVTSSMKVSAVLAAISGAHPASCVESHGVDLLESIKRLTERKHGNDGDRQLVTVNWQPSLPWHLGADSPPIRVRLDIYLCDKIFDIRSDYDLWNVMRHLRPVISTQPLPAPSPRLPLPARTDSAYPFSLAGVLRAMDSTGHAEATQPLGLRLQLKPFQKQSLQWMLDRESTHAASVPLPLASANPDCLPTLTACQP